MGELFKPTPCVAIGNIVDGGTSDAISRSYCVLAFSCGKPSLYFTGRFVGDLGSGIPFASMVRSMEKRVGYVFRARCPSQMGGVYAAAMAVAARMRGIMLWGWWRTIGALTRETRSEIFAPINGNTPVSFDVAVRPENTLIGGRRQRNVQERQKIAFGRSASERVSMTPVSFPMRDAPFSAVMRLAAFWNRAYSLVSHSDLHERLAWLEPAVALQRSAGSLFVPRKQQGANCDRA